MSTSQHVYLPPLTHARFHCWLHSLLPCLSCTGIKDFSGCGQVWAVLKGPYGRTLALCWSEGREARLVDVNQNNIQWTLPDSHNSWPHDMALGAAAMPLTGRF